MEELKKVNGNPEFQAYMTYEEDQEKILNSRLKESKKQGFEEGIKQEKLKNAKVFKELGTPIVIIAKATELSIEEIEKL